MATITISLTSTEFNAMEYAAVSAQEWTEIALKNKARIAIDEIVDKEVKSCIAAGIPLPLTKEAIVEQAFARGTVRKASEITVSAPM